jgi:hypothetical protein
MSAVDSLTMAAEAATILQTVLTVVPPGRRRRWSGRRQRWHAYLAFQQAALDVGTWAAYLPVVELGVPAEQPCVRKLECISFAQLRTLR